MRFIVRYAVLMAVFFCLGNKQTFAADARTDCPMPSADDYFMPALSVPSAPLAVSLDEFSRQWYSKHLRAMSEPTLSCGPGNAEETYRFLWLRTFHHPIAVRVARLKEGIQLSAVELSGAGGYEPGGIIKQIHKSLSSDQWQTLISEVGDCKYWSQPSVDNSGIGMDGARWIIEARREQSYHVVDRWNGGPCDSLGLLFLDLAGLKPTKPDDHIY